MRALRVLASSCQTICCGDCSQFRERDGEMELEPWACRKERKFHDGGAIIPCTGRALSIVEDERLGLTFTGVGLVR